MTHDERIAVLEANDRNIFHQLDEMKEEIKVLRELATALQQLADRLENNTALLSAVDKRLGNIEKRPVQDMEHIRKTAITAAVSGIIGALLSAAAALIF